MKKFNFIIGFIFFFTMMHIEIFGEEITIDSTFSTSCEIFPFGEIELITSLGITADIELHHDTSLVRIIFVPNDDYEYMIFEAYSLIVDDLSFSVREVCDETCFLNELRPYSVKIQIIDAEVTLTSFNYYYEEMENLPQLQLAAKRERDEEKIETMNSRIAEYDMNWVATDNDIVAEYYYQKKEMLGEGYHLLGFEYYYDGVFEFAGHAPYPKVNPDLVRSFDWRDRHGANDSTSAYWDGDLKNTGWLTSVKNQDSCGSCWAFSSIGAVEAIANLYATYHLDYDLSEQQIISCSNPDHSSCLGGHIDSALIFVRDSGVVTEACCEYIIADPLCWQLNICEDPDTVIKINNVLQSETDQDSIRLELINNGPQPVSFQYPGIIQSHAVVLTGFKFDPSDSTLIWIFKNSWGEIGPEKGFERFKISSIHEYTVVNPIYNNDEPLNDTCRDEDGDGYYFWGIGYKPEECNCSDTVDCNDNDPFLGGYDENYNCTCLLTYDSIYHHITTDTTWADTNYVNYTLMIDSGACLTITGYAAFSPEAKIIVSQGGELIIDGGYLTKACPELWRGIEAWGSDTAQYLDEYFGKVVLRNDAIIEFAKYAFSNHCNLCDHYLMRSGGIIIADSSLFRNNETDILLAPFKNEYLGNELPYAASFEVCQFLTTNDFYPDFKPKAHVEIKDVYGVKFSGCVFENETYSSIYPNDLRGIGISGIDVNFFLSKHCNNSSQIPCQDWAICEFKGLEYGIKCLNSQSVRTLNIQEVKFDKNNIGISFSGIDNLSILSNEFICLQKNEEEIGDRFVGGLFMENCSGYHVEANSFEPPLVYFDTLVAYGIGVKNSGSDNNEIYNNTFERLTVGIFSIGENRGRESGLCLKCNDMTDNVNDFLVVEDENPPLGALQGINYYQGNPNDSISFNAPAGNTFTLFSGPASSTNVEDYNYLNVAEKIWYIHHQRQSDPLTYPLDSNYTKETIELLEHDIEYDKLRACPSGIEDDSLKSYFSPRLVINQAVDHIASLNGLLDSLVDGGNTQELNYEVVTSYPDEGLELSQLLLSDSPYLSDTVMKQAIYKEDVLPNAMIRDILQANPQSAKSNDVLNTLEERFEPMPDYMMAQIMEGRESLGAKELLEAEIQSWQRIRSGARSDLMRQFLLDTNVVNPLDSVINFLEAESDVRSQYDLAFAYWNKKDTSQVFQTLGNIPLQYELTDHESTSHQEYVDFIAILRQMLDSNWRAGDLDSVMVQDLFDLMDSDNFDISACARGLLVMGGFFNYVETLVLPDYTKSYRQRFKPGETLVKHEKNDLLRLFPNPAGDYIIIYYELDLKNLNIFITIMDVKGNPVKSFAVNTGQNEIVINIKNLANGYYIAVLYADGRLLEAKKFIKARY